MNTNYAKIQTNAYDRVEALLKIDTLYPKTSSSLDILYSDGKISVFRLYKMRKLRGIYILDIEYIAQDEMVERWLSSQLHMQTLNLQKVAEQERKAKWALTKRIYTDWKIDLRAKKAHKKGSYGHAGP